MGYVKRLWEEMQYSVDREDCPKNLPVILSRENVLSDILVNNGFDHNTAFDLAGKMSEGSISRVIAEASEMTP